MSVHSAGILLYRYQNSRTEVMLVHPGGPFWTHKDKGAWSIPKGEFKDEDPLTAAKREFKEETGLNADGDFIPLGELKQKSGKIVHAWALQQDVDVSEIKSNTFELEWPKNSGRVKSYPEVDRAGWFDTTKAREKILKAQAEFIDRLLEKIK